MGMKKTKEMWLGRATVHSLSSPLCLAHTLRNKLDVSPDAWFQRTPDGGKRCGVGWMFVDESGMWNAEAGSLMNLRRNRAPATSPASCISQASQSRPRFPAISLANHTYATYCINEACQSASHPNTKRCRHSPQLIYSIHCSFGALHRLLIHRQTLVPTHARISSNIPPGRDPP